MIKRTALLILICLFAVTALSGCAYWEGYSKSQCVQLVEEALEEKYGEEFVVADIHVGAGGWYGVSGPLVATCYSKSNDSLFFEAEYNKFGDAGELDDKYIQEIVAKQIKSIINTVLAKYYDNFAVEIDINGLVPAYDPEITNTADATVEGFSTAMNKDDKKLYSNGWIVLEDSQLNKYSEDEIESIIAEIGAELHLMRIDFEFCYVPTDLLRQCLDIVSDEKNKSRDIEKIILLEHKAFGSRYDGQDNTRTRFKPLMG